MSVPLAAFLLVLAWSPAGYAETGWRRVDGGPALSAGLELAITHVRITGKPRFGESSDDVTGAATLVSFSSVYQVDYNFTKNVGLGLRGGIGRFVGAGDVALHAFAGPTLTIYFNRLVYLGIDAFVQTMIFDDVGASVHGTEDLDESFRASLDSDVMVGFDFGLRLGLVFEIVSVVTIVPEIRIGVQPVTVVKEDLQLLYGDSQGSQTVDAERALAVGGGPGIAARFFF